jgi:pimeloyl-ACP methyl ester carboxylesterase
MKSWLFGIALLVGGLFNATGASPSMPLHSGWQAVDGLHLFYREGGDPAAPTIVFLHGYPLSSFMYEKVMDDLLRSQHGKLHVIAMDYPGFGYSDAPDHLAWPYTFDHVADTVRDFLRLRHIQRYSLYMQDYGVPVGFRLIMREPSAIASIVVQNGVIHLDGFPAAQDVNGELRRYWAHRDPRVDQRRTAYANGLSMPQAGWVDEEGIGPDASVLMVQSVQRPGVTQARNDLWFDYGNNLQRYPAWQKQLRAMNMPVLVLWGRRDSFFHRAGCQSLSA